MTTTSAAHYVVDGSNIATEGRSRPSLEQLQEAVTTFMADHPDAMITVVVDATFGHRIDASERPEFDEAVANNELVAPPAGAIGRGDAFVLTIADRAGASVLSNDSFQEFHGDYEWLFDEGRLVGGSRYRTSDGYSSNGHLFAGRCRARRQRNRVHQQPALVERQVSGRASPCQCRGIRRPVRQPARRVARSARRRPGRPLRRGSR